MRAVGVDMGRRRIGLSLSDSSGLLARPWKTIPAGVTVADSARAVAGEIADESRRSDAADEAIEAIVVGLPRRLGGEDTDVTAGARELADRLHGATGIGVHLQDERLTSREAESR